MAYDGKVIIIRIPINSDTWPHYIMDTGAESRDASQCLADYATKIKNFNWMNRF